MSGIIQQNSRIQHHRANGLPTVPPSEDFTDGSWGVTDLVDGEIGVDSNTGRAYIRLGGTIKEITTPQFSSATLEEILGNGASTIGEDMFITDGTDLHISLSSTLTFGDGFGGSNLTISPTDVVTSATAFGTLDGIIIMKPLDVGLNENGTKITHNRIQITPTLGGAFLDMADGGGFGVSLEVGVKTDSRVLEFPDESGVLAIKSSFTGTGAYTNFTIVDGIITNATL